MVCLGVGGPSEAASASQGPGRRRHRTGQLTAQTHRGLTREAKTQGPVKHCPSGESSRRKGHARGLGWRSRPLAMATAPRVTTSPLARPIHTRPLGVCRAFLPECARLACRVQSSPSVVRRRVVVTGFEDDPPPPPQEQEQGTATPQPQQDEQQGQAAKVGRASLVQRRLLPSPPSTPRAWS